MKLAAKARRLKGMEHGKTEQGIPSFASTQMPDRAVHSGLAPFLNGLNVF